MEVIRFIRAWFAYRRAATEAIYDKYDYAEFQQEM